MIKRTWAKLRAPLDAQTKSLSAVSQEQTTALFQLIDEQRKTNRLLEDLLIWNRGISKSLSGLEGSIARVADAAADLKAGQQEAFKNGLMPLRGDLGKIRAATDNIRAASMSSIYADMTEHMLSKQLGLLDTLRKISSERMSLARYGDGEMRMMTRIDFSVPFQRNSYELMDELRRVIIEPADNMLIGMPHMYLDHHWATVFAETWASLKPSLASLNVFANSHVSRPVMFGAFGQQATDEWRKVWEGREVLVVTGEGSRFGLSEALFSSASGIRTLHSSPQEAFHDIPRVLELVSGAPEDLVLISLGPAGTILANEIAKLGKQALDIGHLSSSYENVLNKGAFPEAIPVRK